MEADGAANAVKILDIEKHRELLMAVEGLESNMKEQGEPFDLNSEEWKVVEENINIVLGSLLPNTWPDSTGVIEELSKCHEAKAVLQRKIEILEGIHTCPKCRKDFQDSEPNDAVPLCCPQSQHYLCRRCFMNQGETFRCPSCW